MTQEEPRNRVQKMEFDLQDNRIYFGKGFSGLKSLDILDFSGLQSVVALCSPFNDDNEYPSYVLGLKRKDDYILKTSYLMKNDEGLPFLIYSDTANTVIPKNSRAFAIYDEIMRRAGK